MADVLKTSGPITVERNTTITDVKGQKHTGLKQKTVVDANQKSLVSFSVGSTTKLQVAQAADGKTYVSFDASLFTTRDGKIPPAFKIGNTCMLEVTKTGTNSPVSIDFSKDETRMTIKSSDGQEYTLFVHAGGAKLEMGEGDSRQVFTYNSVDEKGEVIPLDASVSTECIERLCDQNDQILSMPGPAKNTDIEKTRAQLPPYYIALAYCKAKGINHDPAKAMTTLIEDPNPNNKGVSYFVYTPPTAENKQNAVNPLILAKTPDNGICFYSDGKWFAVDQYFFQTIGKNGELNLYFNATTNRQNSYEYALNTGGDLSDFAESKGEDDVAKKNALNELVNFIQSGKKQTEKEYGQPITCRNDTSTPGYKLAEGLTVHPTLKDKRNTLYINLNEKRNKLSATQEETGGIEPPPPPPPPGPTKTPLKKVTEQKKYGPMPGHIVTILAIGLMMCSVLLGPLAGAVLASIGAVAFLGGQGYIMALDYLNDPLHSIKTKYIDPLTEQEREYENQQEAFWENDKALDQNLEQAQGLVAGFDAMWGEEKPLLYGQEFGVTQENAQDFVVPPTWDGFISEENMQQRSDLINEYQRLMDKATSSHLEEKDIESFIKTHIYKGEDKEIFDAIKGKFFDEARKPILDKNVVQAFSKYNKAQRDNITERKTLENRQHNILVYGDKRMLGTAIANPKLTPAQREKLVERYASDVMERFVCESDMDSLDFSAFVSSFPEQERGHISQLLLKAQEKLEVDVSLENKGFKKASRSLKVYSGFTELYESLVKLEDKFRESWRSVPTTISETRMQENKRILNNAIAKSNLAQQRDLLNEKIKSMPTLASLSALSEEDQKHVNDFITSLTSFESDTQKEVANLLVEREELLAQTSFNADIALAEEKYSSGKAWTDMPRSPSYMFSEIDLKSTSSVQIDNFVHGQMASYLAKAKGLSPDDCQKMSTDDIIGTLWDVKLPKEIQLLKNLHEKNTEIKSKVDAKVSERQTSLKETTSAPAKKVADKEIESFVDNYLKNQGYTSKTNKQYKQAKKQLISQIQPIAYRYLATCDITNETERKGKKGASAFKPSLQGKFNVLCELCANGTISSLANQTLLMNANGVALATADANLTEMLTLRHGSDAAKALMSDDKKLQDEVQRLSNEVESYDNAVAKRKENVISLINTISSNKSLAPFVDAFVKHLEGADLENVNSVLDQALSLMDSNKVTLLTSNGIYQTDTIKNHLISALKHSDRKIAKKLKEAEKEEDETARNEKINEIIKDSVKHPKLTRAQKRQQKKEDALFFAKMDKDNQKQAYSEFLKLSQEIKDLDSASKLSEFKAWMAEHENDIKLSGIGKALNNVVITESNIDEILGKCSEMAEKKGAKLQKAVKKKLKKAKKNRKPKKKKKQRKIDKQKAKTAKETLNNEISNAEARESAAAAAESERHAAAEREAGAGHASESSDEMVS